MSKVSLSDIATIRMGQSPKGSDCNIERIGLGLLNGPSEFNEFYPEAVQYTTKGNKVCDTGDILFCVRGSTTGRMNIADKQYAIGRGLASISNNNNLTSNHFLKYLLQYNLSNILKITTGSTFPNLTTNGLSSFEFFIPENMDIEKLNKLLSTLDAKIELNNKINRELEAMAKTLYEYWFVQFDFPNAKGEPYKSSGGKMVYNEELKREIPEGWEIEYIEDILAKNTGKIQIPAKYILVNGKYPVIDQGSDFICGYCNDEDALLNASKEAKIIFGDHTRVLKLINFDFARGADGTQVMYSKSDRLPIHLFYYTLLQIDLSNYGYARHYKFLKQTRIILPKKEISNNFEKIVITYYKKIKENIFQNKTLKAQRDFLLPMLMNGQVSVK